jgi:hypothetical protein
MVVRAYIWHALVPGIIVSEEVDVVEFDGDGGGSWGYDQVNLTVAWSDGTMTTEMLEELEYFEEVVSESG